MTKLFVPLTFLFLMFAGSFFLPASQTAKDSKTARLSRTDAPKPTLSVVLQSQDQDEVVRSTATRETFDFLIAKAEADGSVRVIVGLAVADFQPERRLPSAAAITAQRQAIAQAQDVLIERLSSFQVSSVIEFEYIPFIAMTVDGPVLRQLRISDDVRSIEEDMPVSPTLAQSVPLIGAPAAWAAGYTGSGQVVAILDTGVAKTHPFLSGKIVSEACYSSNTAISSSVCPSGVTSSTASGSGVNCSASVSGCDHGTHVAGIAAGTQTSFSGVAKDAGVIAIQVFSRFSSSNECKTRPAPCALSYTSDQIKGLERVYQLRSSFNIAAANMSLGGGRFFSNCDNENPSLKAAIDNLRSAGIATAISSGNESYKDSMGSPACISTAISVGATGDGSGGAPLDAVANFSNSATFLSLLAPGLAINSSVPGGGFANFQGTSMAAPHVTGAWAVIKSKKPTATVDEVFTALRDTGLPVTDINGITKPRINLNAAINAIGGGQNCASTPIAVGQTLAGTLTTSDCRYPAGSNWYSDAYSFNGNAGQQVSIAMSSSSFDTWVALKGPSGSELVVNNDGGGGTNSRIPATSGFYTLPSTGTFVIQASSNLINATGTYTVNLSGTPSGAPNNNFAGAQVISGSSGNVNGNNTGATKEPGEPNHGGNSGGASVWYRWQAPASGIVTMTTAGSNFDTLLGVYTGNNVNALTIIAGNDDAGPSDLSSRVQFNAVVGVTYRIAVDGFLGATGNIVLNWSSVQPGPANNHFANAQIINGNSGSVNGNNINASTEPGEPDHAGNNGGVSVWYRWQAPASGTIVISTAGSNFDTLLGVYTGGSVSSLVLVASNDDEAFPSILSSRVAFNAIAGTTYRLVVDGYSGSTGNISLNWNLTAAGPPNNNFASAQLITGSSGSATGTNTGATSEPGEPNHAGIVGGKSIWYRWQAPANGTVSFDSFGSNFDTLLAVYTGSAVNSLTLIASNDDFGGLQSKVTFSAVSGTVYRLAVDGFSGASGNIVLNWSQTSTLSSVQLNAASYLIGETGGSLPVTVTRTNTSGAATVNYASSDSAALQECIVVNGIASSRCDYATSVGTARFAAGEGTKTVFIPIVDDAYAEGNENFTITLSNAVGATLGPIASASIRIQDNDSVNGTNPLNGNPFFVRQHYIDFLGREPEQAGLDGWLRVLNECGTTFQPPCDRIEVSAGFFRSPEFQQRGYFIYRFYSAVGRIPLYPEFMPDLAKVSGFLSDQQLEANKAAFVTEFMTRTAFQNRYSSTFGNPTAYVDALLQTVGLPNHPSRQSWINLLNSNNNAATRAQVLRALVESVEVYNKYFNEAFVIMQYFGYLRRTADASYLQWIQTMNQTGGDYRTMINGFLNSAEYRQRFGP